MSIRKSFLTLLALFLFSWGLQAQYETILYDRERNLFNKGNELPAETNFIVNGEITQTTDMVQIEIFKAGKHRSPLYINRWTRSVTNKGNQFEIPVNYKLRSSNNYDFKLSNYKVADNKNKEAARKEIVQSMNKYLQSTFVAKGNHLRMNKNRKTVLRELNTITKKGLSNHKSMYDMPFDGYSTIISQKLRQISKSEQAIDFKLDIKDKEQKEDKNMKKSTEKLLGANQQVEELNKILNEELGSYLKNDLYAFQGSSDIASYPVESTRNYLAVNVGYGGIYLNNDGTDVSTASAPFVGVSIPFSGSALAPAFFKNTAISTGVFITDLKDDNNQVMSGPFIKRPFYLALGYRALQFVRINAGATFIEQNKDNLSKDKEIKLKPFIGISAEINLSATLGRK
ncbi:MAG: hypothetical protein IPL35_03945 [Sphingobacteriales bacterium]|nr:hypothetical protein [Sphingobacteriales bacterium]